MADREADDAAREEKKARKRWEEDHRQPDGWERYRLLADVVDLQRRVVDMGDHKVRFALVIAGGLNAVLFMVAVRVPTAEAVPEGLRAPRSWPPERAAPAPTRQGRRAGRLEPRARVRVAATASSTGGMRTTW